MCGLDLIWKCFLLVFSTYDLESALLKQSVSVFALKKHLHLAQSRAIDKLHHGAPAANTGHRNLSLSVHVSCRALSPTRRTRYGSLSFNYFTWVLPECGWNQVFCAEDSPASIRSFAAWYVLQCRMGIHSQIRILWMCPTSADTFRYGEDMAPRIL